MEIKINGVDFWDSFDAMKYYSFPKNYKENKKQTAKYMCESGDYIAARKMDGIWALIIRDEEGNFHLRSRTPNVNGGFADKAEWIPYITESLKDLPNGTVLLGEIYFPNDEGSRKVTSVLNCLKDKCLERQAAGKILNFYCFDVLAYKSVVLLDMPISTRVGTYLNKELAEILKNPYLCAAKYMEGKELWEEYCKIIDEGGEGIVLVKKECKYLCGKRTAWMTLKLKKELQETIDVYITGNYKPATRLYDGKNIENWGYWQNIRTNEFTNVNKFEEYNDGGPWEPVTKGYYNGWASSIEVAVKKDGEEYPIAWLSGITDEIKEKIVKKNEELKGKVVEITAMELEKIDGHLSLRHSKIVNWRDDKAAEDCDFSQLA